MFYLPYDIIYNISSYCSSSDMIRLMKCNKELYNMMPVISTQLNFTIYKDIKKLDFISKLPYKIKKLNMSVEYSFITQNFAFCDDDFITSHSIKELNMSHCNKLLITNEAFQYLRGIKILKYELLQ